MFRITRNHKLIDTVAVSDVDLIICDHKYLTLYTKGKTYLYDGTIKGVLEAYPGHFIQVRRNALVRPSAFSGLLMRRYRYYHLIPNNKDYPDVLVGRRTIDEIADKFPRLTTDGRKG